jgi:hypothetical protein
MTTLVALLSSEPVWMVPSKQNAKAVKEAVDRHRRYAGGSLILLGMSCSHACKVVFLQWVFVI